MIETDLQLLARYHGDRDEGAFAELVGRHLNLVYCAALRQVRTHALAEEVVQSVFYDLARAATRLGSGAIVPAWLYEVTRRTAIDVLRRETRRQAREQTAFEMNAHAQSEATWEQIGPLLDEAMQQLEPKDRTAVLLRYFENKSLREVGQALGASEDAAHKRLSRAVERLRGYFAAQGAVLGAAGLASMLSIRAVQAAPGGLAASVVHSYAAGGIAATLTVFTMTTLQKSAVVGAVAIVGLSTALHLERRQSQALRETLAELHRASSGTIEASPAVEATDPGRAKLEENRIELLRLRGQVALLRSQVAGRAADKPAKAVASPPSGPPASSTVKPLVSATFQARVALGQTLISGGWPGSPGKRIYLLSTPGKEANHDGIMFQSKIVEAPEAVWNQLGWPGLQENREGANQGLLDEAQFKELVAFMEAQEGVDVLAAPRISTADGRGAQIVVGDSTEADSNLWISVVPTTTEDGKGVDMALKLNIPARRAGSDTEKQPSR